MITLARTYRFAAAHTLRSPHLSAADNARVYGKCAHPAGHGHDYHLEFQLRAPRLTDDVVVGHGWLDQLVARVIAPRFDRRDLNQTFGGDVITTGENLAVAAHRLLAPHLPDGVALTVRLVETEKNSFAFHGQ